MDRMTKQDELVFLPLGGSGEIGMNFNAYGFGPENDRQWIIVDCGVLFGREGNTPGVDLIMPDIRYLVERAETLADRLEVLLKQGRTMEAPPPAAPLPPVAPKAEAPGGQSQAERDLMRALVRGHAAGKG